MRSLNLGFALSLGLALAALGCGRHHGGGSNPSSPALSVSSFSIDSPQLVKSGQDLTYHDTISNTGNEDSDNLTYQLYVSNSQITLSNFASSSVVPIGSLRSVGSINQDDDRSESITFTVVQNGPGPLSSGNGFVAMVVNSTGSSAAIISVNVPVQIH